MHQNTEGLWRVLESFCVRPGAAAGPSDGGTGCTEGLWRVLESSCVRPGGAAGPSDGGTGNTEGLWRVLESSCVRGRIIPSGRICVKGEFIVLLNGLIRKGSTIRPS